VNDCIHVVTPVTKQIPATELRLQPSWSLVFTVHACYSVFKVSVAASHRFSACWAWSLL